MKASVTILTLLIIAGSATAQQPTTTPDYSRDTLLRIVAGNQEKREEPLVRFEIGAVSFTALGSQWQFNYLPLTPRLSGTEVDVTQTWPDPFALTRTALATSPRVWRTQRRLNEELLRIDRMERAKIRVTVGMD